MAKRKSDQNHITIKDIADICDVSVSTVSKVLAGEDNFRSETIQKIMRAARKHHYSPNAFARGMVTKKNSNLVGFFVPNIMNPFFSEMIDAVEKKLSDEGYILALCIYDDNAEKMKDFLRFLTEVRASGAIFGSCREDSCAEAIKNANDYMHIVSIQGDIDGVDRVDVTDYEGTYEIIEYLIGRGHKKIGFIGYRYDISILRNRLNGYYDALRAHNIPINNEYVCEGAHHTRSGREMTRHLLDMDDPPTAIHCFNEFMAEAAYYEIRKNGLRIPEDISVTGFDNITISQVLYPRLTTVGEPIETMAQLSIDMLMGRIKNRDFTTLPRHIYVEHKFVERESVATIR